MPFQYLDIKNYKPRVDEVFLFDSNVWIHYHDQVNPKHWQKPYTKFLNSLLGGATDPNIILPSCIVSEVSNRLLRDRYCKLYMQSPAGKAAIVRKPISEKDVFKEIYRKELHYKRDRDSVYVSIYSYSLNILPVSDHFESRNLDDLTTSFTELDFNDWTIYELAKKYKATIVTDDGDFQVENYPIVTNNSRLLSIMK